MKGKINFILLLLLFVCGSVNASGSFSDYNGSINKANKYILDFDRYKLFIDSSDKYLYDGSNLNSSSLFKNGGFINTYEFNSTMIKNDSYLSTGARYFTMTENGNNVDVVNVRMIGSYNKYDSFESRVTEFIIPKAEITGSGTRTDPWVFVNIKYNVTVNLVGATINGSSSKTQIVENGNSLSLNIVPKTGFILANSNCDKGVFDKKTNVLYFNNVSSNVTCNLTFKTSKKEYAYTGKSEIFTAEMSGKYRITAYGAQGAESGGKGGQVIGDISLNIGEVLTLNIGGTNGYNGGGAYNNNQYVQGGGATTVKYNNSNVIIAAGGGGGATGTAGGSGNGSGGASVGAGAGLAGSNGGGGSKSLNYSTKVNCRQTGGECIRYTTGECCPWVCSGGGYSCMRWSDTPGAYTGSSGACGIVGCIACQCNGSYECSPCQECAAYSPVTETCDTQVTSGKGGNGGANATTSIITNVTKSNGINSGNGKLIIQYIGE